MAVKTTKKRAAAAGHTRRYSQGTMIERVRQSLGLREKPSREVRQADADGDAADRLVGEADPSDVKRLCDQYDLRREDLGRMTGFSLRALADWSAGKLPSEPAKRRLHEIRRLLDSLARVVKPEAISPWLKKRNPAFENMTPIQVIEVGEIDRLWQMVHHMSSDSVD